MEINFVPVHAMKSCWGEEIYIHSFITSASDGGEWPGLEADHSPSSNVMVKNELN